MLNISTDKLKFLIPYTGVLFIFLGVIKLTIYYHAFNIQINNFLDFTEIITAFTNDLLFIAFIFFSTSLFHFLLTTKDEVLTSINWQEAYINESKFLKRLNYAKKIFNIVLIINLGFLLSLLTITLFLKKSISSYFFMSWVIFDLSLLSQILLLQYRRKSFITYKIKLETSITNIIAYLIIVTFLLLSTTYSEIYSVKFDKKYIKTTFTVGNEKYISDSSHYYIGKTKNYLFYYCENEKRTVVFPMTEIKEIQYFLK